MTPITQEQALEALSHWRPMDEGRAAQTQIVRNFINQSGWQPIETAPKDGTYIQVARKDEAFGWILGVSQWFADPVMGGWISKGTGFFGELGLADPTHWCPLNSPPQDKDQ